MADLSHGTYPNLFEHNARLYPELVAIEDLHRSVTYAELSAKSNAIANALLQCGIQKEQVTGVLLPGRSGLLAAMFGCFKAGSIYMPLDVKLSPARLKYIFDHYFDGVLITCPEWLDEALQIVANQSEDVNYIVVVDEQLETEIYAHDKGELTAIEAEDLSTENVPVNVERDDSAYLYFTSGTTGEPKGILGRHECLLHYITWATEAFGVEPGFRHSFTAQVTFDATLIDTLIPLGAGATVVIPQYTIKNGVEKFVEWVNTANLSVIQCVPSVFRMVTKYIRSIGGKDYWSSLKFAILTGEVLYSKDITNWREVCDAQAKLVNIYGTSETTIADTYHIIDEVPEDPSQPLHVGKPIDDTFLAVIKGDRLCRIGEIGEVYIKSLYPTKGYYKNQELTDLAFVQNPLIKDRKDIIYRTGDLGKFLPDRTIEVIGRKDKQIKFNGIRLELKEIERAMLNVPSVNEVYVKYIENEDGGQLIAYYVGAAVTPEAVRETLQQHLNENVIPPFILQMPEFPLTINGKIDKRNLPLPEEALQAEAIVEPANEKEAQILNIWKVVLGLEKISVEKSFFLSGGNSLKAIQLTAALFKQFSVEVTIRDIFEHDTIRKQSNFLADASGVDYAGIPTVAAAKSYPVSNVQRRMWMLNQMIEQAAAYHIHGLYTLQGDLNIEALKASVEEIIARHESLRTIINEEGDQLVQVILPTSDEAIANAIRFDEAVHAGQDVEEALNAESDKGFDLAEELPVRVLFKRTAEESKLLVSVHHIACDGLSIENFIGELAVIYNAKADGKDYELAPLKVQFKDYSAWMDNRLAADGNLQEAREYWKKQFAEEAAALQLPSDLRRPSVKSFAGNRESVELDTSLVHELRAVAKKHEISLFTLLSASLKTLLYRYSGQKDITIGAPVSGRSHADLKPQIGCYVNTIALRTQFEDTTVFADLLAAEKETVLNGLSHQDYPYDRLIEDLELRTAPNRNPLFDVMLHLLNTNNSAGELTLLNGVSAKREEVAFNTNKFDLVFQFAESEEALKLDVEYNTSLFTPKRAERIGKHLANLLQQIAEVDTIAIDHIVLEETTEQEQANDSAEAGNVLPILRTAAAQKGDKVAVVHGDATRTYAEIDAASDYMASKMIATGRVKPNDLVAVVGTHSLDLVQMLVAVLKTGAAYLPISADYPQERIDYILDDAKPKMVIAITDEDAEKLQNREEKIFTVSALSQHAGLGVNLPENVQSDDLAYVIYTSGSTGKPKGVQVTHGNLERLFFGQGELFDFTSEDTWMLFHSFCFDFSVWEIFGALLNGGKLIITESETAKDANAVADLVIDHGVTVLNQTPSAFVNLSKAICSHVDSTNHSIRKVIFGGEALQPKTLADWYNAFPDVQLINMYGITETTVHVSYKELTQEDITSNTASIGKALPSMKMRLVDAFGNTIAPGEIGEIVVAGTGVSKGYLNRPELTAERFVTFENNDEVWYRSGDLGRYDENGEILYSNRSDFQIQLRGYRIELDEVNSAILAFDGVADAHTILREMADDQMLITFFSAADSVDVDALRSSVSKQLPSYMIPSIFMQLDELPLTSNGKVDRTKLQQMPLKVSAKYAGRKVHTEIEGKLRSIWQEVLGVEEIPTDVHFFEIGGNSLSAFKVINKIQSRFNVKTDLKAFLDNPTIQEFGIYIEKAERQEQGVIPKVADQDSYAVTEIQEQFWINEQFSEKEKQPAPGMLILHGAFDFEAFNSAVNALVERHESLRTTFKVVDGEIRQIVHAAGDMKLSHRHKIVKTVGQARTEVIRICESQQKFNLEAGPLLRFDLITIEEENETVLLFEIHHIVSDGWSIELVRRELMDVYNAATNKTLNHAEPLEIQYRDYSVWYNHLLRSKELGASAMYWRNQLADVRSTPLTTDFERPATKASIGKYIDHIWAPSTFSAFAEFVKSKKTSEFTVLGAMINTLQYCLTGKEDQVLGTPTANRNHEQLENQVGNYLNIIPVVSKVASDQSFDNTLEAFKSEAIEAFNHQLYPFHKMVDQLQRERDMARNPIFDVGFTLQNQMEEHGKGTYSFDPKSMAKYINADDLRVALASDLWFIAIPQADSIHWKVLYDSTLFKKETVVEITNTLEALALEIVSEPTKKVNELLTSATTEPQPQINIELDF